MLTQNTRSLFDRLAGPFARRAPAPPPPPPPPVSANVAPPTVTWPDPVKSIRVGMTCPNCRSRARKPVKLTVNFQTPDHPMRHSRVLSCPDCTCLFYEDQNPPDYTEESMLGRGRTAFYLQQGAGVSLITRPLACVRRPPGSTYLEVGCGFGFGLDFAIRAKGWTGTGIDPAGLSALGRDLLDVPIEQRYLGEDEPAFTNTCDVVMASETIEHVPSPIAFVRTLRRALKPGGILVLTTPNAAEIDPSKSQGLLVPLLSPGLHLVFQNAGSLRRLLEIAGFTHVEEQTDSVSLVVFASDAPFTLENDPAVLREVYRAYLEERARTVPADSDLFLGFAGRALQESSNDGDFARAGRATALLRDGCQKRFGFDIETIAALPAESKNCSLERLAELMPLNLGGILYADGMRCLAEGSPPRETLAARFACAAAAADAMRRALGELAMEDGMSETIAWAARAEGFLCDAAAGAPDIATRLGALPPAPPGGEPGAARREEIVERALAWMVNAGHIALGANMAEATGLQTRPWANPPDGDTAPPPLPASRRDALFCLAVIDSQLDGSGDAARGRRRFSALRRMLQGHGLGGASPDFPGQVIYGELQALGLLGDRAGQIALIDDAVAAFHLLPDTVVADLKSRAAEMRREIEETARAAAETARYEEDQRLLAFVSLVNAGDHVAAKPLGAEIAARDYATDADAPLTPGQQSALFALGVLNVQIDGEPERAEDYFGHVRRTLTPEPGAPVPDLFWAALRGELRAITINRDAEAAEHHRVALLTALDRPANETPPDLLVAPEPPPPEVVLDIKRQQLVTRVNAGDFDAARPFAAIVAAQPYATDAEAPLSPGQRDALFALAVLDVQDGGDPSRARARFARVRAAATPRDGEPAPDLLWAAIRGELQAARIVDGAAAADAHRRMLLTAARDRKSEIPADLLAPIIAPAA